MQTPLSPNRPYTRPQSARPHAAALGLSLYPGPGLKVIELDPNACPTPPQPLSAPGRPYSALLGLRDPTWPYPCTQGLVREKLKPNACPTPPQPHSALTGPTRPHSAPLGLILDPGPVLEEFESQCMPNPSPTPLSPNRPCWALLGPTRRTGPHAAPLGLSLQPGPSLRAI